jgi:hypothetical protein
MSEIRLNAANQCRRAAAKHDAFREGTVAENSTWSSRATGDTRMFDDTANKSMKLFIMC